MKIDHDCLVTCGGTDGCGDLNIHDLAGHSERTKPFYQDSKGQVIYSIAISPEGTYMAAGSQNGLVRVWPFLGQDNSNLIPFILEIYHSLTPVLSLAFLTDDMLLSGGYDGKLRLISVQRKRHIAQIAAHQSPICSLVPLGSRVAASLDVDGILKIWDIELLSCAIMYTGFQFPKEFRFVLPSLTFSEETGHLCCPSANGNMHLFDLKAQCSHEIIEAHQGSFYAMASFGKYMATGGFRDNTVKIWDLETKELISENKTSLPFLRLCSIGKERMAAICADSDKTSSCHIFNFPDLQPADFITDGNLYSVTSLHSSLHDRINQARAMQWKNDLIEKARVHIMNPVQMEPYANLLIEKGFEVDAMLLQAESARLRNKPLHELKSLLRLTDLINISEETLPIYRSLALLLENINEPKLAIEIYEKIKILTGNVVDEKIIKLKKHRHFNLNPSVTIRSDMSHPVTLAQEIEKNMVLGRPLRWRITIRSHERQYFEIKTLNNLASWEDRIHQVATSKGHPIEMGKEDVVLYDGQEALAVSWLKVSNFGILSPVPYVYYALDIKSNNGLLLGEGHGIFDPNMLELGDDINGYNNDVLEAYNSIHIQKETGDWLKRVHGGMINLDKQEYFKR